jgi:hypothetical protein
MRKQNFATKGTLPNKETFVNKETFDYAKSPSKVV